MPDSPFGFAFIQRLVERVLATVAFVEVAGDDGGLFLPWRNLLDDTSAGGVRLWVAPATSRFDRMVHVRLLAAPVDTQLFFLFGRPESVVPHFHAQVVQFSPEACVYNADIIPRLDPVDHPGYFRDVYEPVTRAYWKAATDTKNVCAMAPANPAVAAYLSPWSIAAGRPTKRAELERVGPSIDAYLDQCLALAVALQYPPPPAAQMRERDRRHLALLHSDDLDPRAWKGVYRIVGEPLGHRLKEILAHPLDRGAAT